MKGKRELTQEERHVLNYMGGARISLIHTMREVLIKFLQAKGKEQGRTLSKAIICKINREIDVPWMGKVCNVVFKDKMSLETLELYYDRLFLDAYTPVKPEGLRNFDKYPLRGTTGVCK